VSRPYAKAERSLAKADPVMAALIAEAGPCTLEPRHDAPFPALLRAIVYQQLSGKAAATIHGRVLALFGGEVPPPDVLLSEPEEALRAAGLSRAKTAAVRDLAQKVLDGELPMYEEAAALPDDALVERLTKVRGVGPWTVEMYLIFGLGHTDVLPVSDLGVRQGFRLRYGGDALPDATTLRAHAERWRPWRSIASWYLWRAVDLARSGS